MTRDIDQLSDALRRQYPEITVEQSRAAPSERDADLEGETVWHLKHPAALADVHVGSSTGNAPFVVQSDLAPPTVARTIDQAVRLVRERMGLVIRSG